MAKGSVPVNRLMVGLIALACLIAGGVIWFTRESGTADTQSYLWSAAFMRVGLLMSAFWLALPSKTREAAWTNLSLSQSAGVLLAIVGVATRPRIAIPLLIMLAIVGYFLNPRRRNRTPRPWED